MLKAKWAIIVFSFIYPLIASAIITQEANWLVELNSGPLPQHIPKVVDLVGKEQIIDYTRYFAQAGGLDADLVIRIAYCESGYRPEARNKMSTASGIFQFIASTWVSTRDDMGRDNSLDLRFNAKENIDTALYKLKNGGIRAWAASKHCWT